MKAKRTRRKAAPERVPDDWEPRLGGAIDGPVEMAVMVGPDGQRHAVVLPRSVAKLEGEAAEVVSQLQHAAADAEKARRRVERLVLEAREVGASWDAIGWSVGVTGSAARQRWGQ